MTFTDTLELTFASPDLRHAFMVYFAELGLSIRNWDALFQELNDRGDHILARLDSAGNVIGFLLYASKTMTSGFYSAELGCIDEFYIAPAYRRQGHGSALLAAAEALLAQQGCGYAMLTTDSAAGFFRRHGYTLQLGIMAKNGDPVFVKTLGRSTCV